MATTWLNARAPAPAARSVPAARPLQRTRNRLAGTNVISANDRPARSIDMAIFATVFAALGRFAGKLLTTSLGWASTLLFGRVPQDKQILLVLMTFGSVIWVVLVLGVVLPEAGTIILGFVPIPDFIDENWVRLAMLIGALVVPLLIGVAGWLILPEARRPRGADAVKSILRGYPLAFVLAFVLVFLAVVALVRKARSLVKRWSDAHVPIVVQEGGYDQLVADLRHALGEADLEVAARPAPAVLATPASLLAAVAGQGVRSLVPGRVIQLVGPDLEIVLHPSDIAIAGSGLAVARARAAIASRLGATAAFMTTTAESQAIEERLRALGGRRRIDDHAAAELASIDRALAGLEIDYAEWEVLYRQRLQVERDLRSGRRPGSGPAEVTGIGGRQAQPGDRTVGHPLEYAAAAAVVGLVTLDLVLAVRYRSGP